MPGRPVSTVALAVAPIPAAAPFVLVGELDADNARRIYTDVRTHGDNVVGDVVINCEQVTFVDCSTVGAFARAAWQLRSENRRVVLVGLHRTCRRLFEITGSLELFDERPETPSL